METKEEITNRSVNTHHGHAIRRLRHAQGLSQMQLGELVHLVQQRISYYEEKKEIDPEMLDRFAKALKVPVELIKNMEEDSKLSFYIENNTQNQENENSPDSSNIGINNDNSTNNYTDKALYTALEQMQKLYEKGMELYESSLQSNNNLLKTLQERIDLLEKQQNK
ncbi:helix-turn-helix domain-containing protein [Parabacteroides pacaensis]|uniref:helix-turn-helix domain-containing protein n=1 Tax=Parabacteroides pacaensis TaxID=2086575 RepID=UPI000D0EC960|nr:helix-turn-helix transcriptional regulator [Parabacteroides pacaensis]